MANISSFITWFLTQVYLIFTFCFDKLDAIYITSNVSLLDFMITILILSGIVSILVAQPRNVMRIEKHYESRKGGD